MKKHLFTMLVVIALMAMFTGTVGAAPQMSVTFLEAFWTGSGVNFKFQVDEDLGGGWLKANISWNGGSVNMTCIQEGDIVTCTGPKSAADKDIVVTFQGASYSTHVKSNPFCYSVYDWNYPSPFTSWVNYGTHCQEVAADSGDTVTWFNPGFGGGTAWTYEYLPASPTPCSFIPVNEDAFYFPTCPSTPT